MRRLEASFISLKGLVCFVDALFSKAWKFDRYSNDCFVEVMELPNHCDRHDVGARNLLATFVLVMVVVDDDDDDDD